MAYILQLLNPIIHKGDRLMKRLLCICILLGYAFVLGQTESAQDSPPIAAVQFSGSGITDLETQVLFNRFLEELTKASDNSLMDQENINEKIAGLEIGTAGCISDECLQAGLGALGVQQLLAGSINFTKNKYRLKVR